MSNQIINDKIVNRKIAFNENLKILQVRASMLIENNNKQDISYQTFFDTIMVQLRNLIIDKENSLLLFFKKNKDTKALDKINEFIGIELIKNFTIHDAIKKINNQLICHNDDKIFKEKERVIYSEIINELTNKDSKWNILNISSKLYEIYQNSDIKHT